MAAASRGATSVAVINAAAIPISVRRTVGLVLMAMTVAHAVPDPSLRRPGIVGGVNGFRSWIVDLVEALLDEGHEFADVRGRAEVVHRVRIDWWLASPSGVR